MPKAAPALGTVEASESLLKDLYLDLRARLVEWADVTQQTAQARMGYVGQHLVSVVTGFPGGKSGARGRDLIHPDGRHSEIKTCYRVDQLGHCPNCGERVAAIEEKCGGCESTRINRKDDSKWLIGIRHDGEFREILSPQDYYLVLFDFVDLADPTRIRAGIWTVKPTNPGFALCMVDYYLNIRARSTSKAPFNLWPFQIKFALMRPLMIYEAVLNVPDNQIETRCFPGRDHAQPFPLAPLADYARTTTLTEDIVSEAAASLGMEMTAIRGKAQLLTALQAHVEASRIPNDTVADCLAKAVYDEKVRPHTPSLPAEISEALEF